MRVSAIPFENSLAEVTGGKGMPPGVSEGAPTDQSSLGDSQRGFQRGLLDPQPGPRSSRRVFVGAQCAFLSSPCPGRLVLFLAERIRAG